MKTISSKLLSANPHVSVLFTTREGGISHPPYGELNLAFHVGDSPDDVRQNHLLLAKAIGYDPQRLIHMRQIHSDTVTVVDETMSFDTPPQSDALITNCIDMPLMVMSADCTPILLYDPINHAIGAVHAGRAGALNAIVTKTLTKMGENYGTSVNSVQVVLGPSIHGCCYEINETIAEDVMGQGYLEALRREDHRVYLEVNRILVMQLQRFGIRSEQIEVAHQCTSCNSEEFFSYRADTQKTGRIAGVIMLRPLPS